MLIALFSQVEIFLVLGVMNEFLDIVSWTFWVVCYGTLDPISNLCFSRSPLILCWQGKGSTPFDCQVWEGVQISHFASFDTLGKEDLITFVWRWDCRYNFGLTDQGGRAVSLLLNGDESSSFLLGLL